MAKVDKVDWMVKVKANAGLLFLAGMGLLVLIRLVMVSMESSAVAPQTPTVPPTPLTPGISEDSIDYIKVKILLDPWKEFDQSPINALGRFNMFDPKLVQDARRLEQSANDKVIQARAAFRDGNLAQARELVLEALAMRPNHLAGRQLLAEIEQRLGTADTTASASRKD